MNWASQTVLKKKSTSVSTYALNGKNSSMKLYGPRDCTGGGIYGLRQIKARKSDSSNVVSINNFAALELVVKLLRPVGVVIATPLFIPGVFAKEVGECHECSKKRLPKAGELPLYDTSDENSEFKVVEQPKSSLEDAISITRKAATNYIGALDGARKHAVEVYHTGVSHSKSSYDYITEEGNVVPRSIAIASGGLVGLLLGIRGGKFKKIMYTSLGAGAVASACYPSQAKEYASKGYGIASEQTTKVVKEYAGYDLNNATSDVKEKLGNLSISKKVANLNISEKISNVVQAAKEYSKKLLRLKKPDKPAEGDLGQSNPADKDLYTTRTR